MLVSKSAIVLTVVIDTPLALPACFDGTDITEGRMSVFSAQ